MGIYLHQGRSQSQLIIGYQKALEADKIKASGAFLVFIGTTVNYCKISYLNAKVVHGIVHELYIENHVQSRILLKTLKQSKQSSKK